MSNEAITLCRWVGGGGGIDKVTGQTGEVLGDEFN